MKRLVLAALGKVGYTMMKVKSVFPFDMDAGFKEIYDTCHPYSLTSPERMYSIYKAVEYLTRYRIEGDLVECGVWKGGSTMAMALTLKKFGDTTRTIRLYDTYEGMPAASPKDVDSGGRSGETMRKDLEAKSEKMYYSSLEEACRNILSTGYPQENIVFIKGKVEETLPAAAPAKIALLSLDTDWYESTYHELVHLFPRLVPSGVLYIDDYGHWKGSREATDTYFAETGVKILLTRVDYTGRIAVKL